MRACSASSKAKCHMLTVYNCIAYAHDLRLVVLAAVICALASFTAITLLQHVRKSAARMRSLWLTVSAVTTGFGIWATHFVAMLAFEPGLPSGYNITLTILSLIVAIVVTWVGLAVALSATSVARVSSLPETRREAWAIFTGKPRKRSVNVPVC